MAASPVGARDLPASSGSRPELRQEGRARGLRGGDSEIGWWVGIDARYRPQTRTGNLGTCGGQGKLRLGASARRVTVSTSSRAPLADRAVDSADATTN